MEDIRFSDGAVWCISDLESCQLLLLCSKLFYCLRLPIPSQHWGRWSNIQGNERMLGSEKYLRSGKKPTPHYRTNAVLPTFCIKCYLSYSSFIIQTALKSMLLSDIGFWVQHPFVCPETKNPHKKCSFRTQTSCKWSAHDFNLILVFTALSVHIFTLHFQTLVFFQDHHEDHQGSVDGG